MMKIKLNIGLIITAALLLFAGCQPSYSTEMSISLESAVTNETAQTPSESVDPIDILVTIGKIARDNGLQMQTPDTDEASLLDMADTEELLSNPTTQVDNTTHYQHPDLPVFLTVTRNQTEFLLLIHHAPDENGIPNPDAQKLYNTLQEQLTAQFPQPKPQK